jgi:type VI secretion system protein ImpH
MDIRAELLARMMAEVQYLETEQILFYPKNYHQRWGTPDVLQVSEGWSKQMQKALVEIEVSREGMFDALPESIFLHPEENYPDDVYRVKALSEQEKSARKFLLPFEQMFYWLRLENELQEAGLENQPEEVWKKLLNCGFPLLETLSDDFQDILLQMLPFLPDIVGDWHKTAQCLSIFLGEKVEIRAIAPPVYMLSDNAQKRLGECYLGEDMLLGATFMDATPGIEIKIELQGTDVSSFLENGSKRRLIEEELLPLLLPVEIPYETVLSVNLSQEVFVLGQSSDTGNHNMSGNGTSNILGFVHLGHLLSPNSGNKNNQGRIEIKLNTQFTHTII